jgi:outer membrane protein assembly factor BamA
MRFLAGLITVAALFAQQKKHAEPAPAVFPLEALHVEGNKKLTVEKILAVAGLKIGEPVIRTDFDQARKRLMATGAFQSVAYEFKPSMDAKGVDGLLRVVEVEYWFPYRFEDLPATDEALRAVLRKQELILDDRIPATKEVITRYTAAIEEFLGGKVEVTGKVMSDVPDQPTIVFRPPGARPNIAEVHFEGNEILPTAALVNSLAPVAIGVPYSEATIEELLDASTRSLYEGRGRVGVSFPKVLVEKSSKVDGVNVTITVKEGPSYNLGSVKVTGVPPDELDGIRNIGKWRAGDIADLEAVRTGAIKITDRLRNNGYLHATAKTDKTIHENEHTVDALITVTAGPQYHMGKLNIDGLDLLTEPQIRKVWSMKTGDPFRPDYPDQFLKDLRAQGVFENLGETRAEKTNDEKTHTVDVKLFFGLAKPKEKTGVKLPGGRGGIQQ